MIHLSASRSSQYRGVMPDPTTVRAEPTPTSRAARTRPPRSGRLRIYLGYAAGVGKTFSMLTEARVRSAAGVDVIVGWISPRARSATRDLIAGLERQPEPDFDLDAAVARAPELLVLDELAHENPPGSRHARRWQDVEELLATGIDVFTTADVQHLESLNDVVASITGRQERSTVPDRVFDRADEIELIDVPPDQLLQRTDGAGKETVRLKPQLHALRELALRKSADRVHEQVAVARTGSAARPTWATREQLLVCVGPSPTSAKVIRSARRLAVGLRGGWIAAAVVGRGGRRLPAAESARVAAHLELAARLGAETATLEGHDVAQELLDFAARRAVTKIVMGRTGPPRVRFPFRRRGLVEELIRRSGADVDVYVVRGLDEDDAVPPRPARPVDRDRRFAAQLESAATMMLATGVALALSTVHLSHANVVMTLLLGVTTAAARRGLAAAATASILGVLAFNFFFTAPRFTFAMSDPNDVFTLAVMLVIALTVGGLAARLRSHSQVTRRALHKSEALFQLSRRLAMAANRLDIVRAGREQLAASLAADVGILLPDATGALRAAEGGEATFLDEDGEREAAEWVFRNGRAAGLGTDTLPATRALYLPLETPDGRVGVLGVRPVAGESLGPDPRRVAETSASQIAFALQRDALATETRAVLLAAETERTRATILSAISHDLRTPLATISGAGSSLVESANDLSEATRHDLASTICEESSRLSRLVENVLQMTRLESGAVKPDRVLTPIDDVVGSAFERLRGRLARARVTVDLPVDLPLVPMDGVLIEQVLINLIENALNHAGPDVHIVLRAGADPKHAWLEVEDDGPGLVPGSAEVVFEKFFRAARPEHGARGVGLGLAICRAIARAHGGDVEAMPAASGARFRLVLPRDAEAARDDP